MNEICLAMMRRPLIAVVGHTAHSNLSQEEPSRGSMAGVIGSFARGRRSVELLLLEANNHTERSLEPTAESAVETGRQPEPGREDDNKGGSIVVDEMFKNITEELLRYLDQNLEQFRYSTEAYVMTPVAVFGILFNILSLVALALDHRTAKSYRSFHFVYLMSQVMFLVTAVFFIQMKGHRAKKKNTDSFLGYIESLEPINYLSICFGIVHFAQPWVLTTLADHGRKSLESLFEIGPKPTFPKLLLSGTAIFTVLQFVTYLPPVRIRLYRALSGSYSLCNTPIEKQWNVDRPIRGDIHGLYLGYAMKLRQF